MSDIFLSYANSDLERARPVARALEARGWSVFWDRKVPPGGVWEQIIEENLYDAACVVVLWTGDSVKSHWVRNEARAGAERRCLVPALLDKSVRIPLAFNHIQAASLVDWRGQADHHGWEALAQAVAGHLGEPSSIAPDRGQARVNDAAVTERAGLPPKRSPWRVIASALGLDRPQPGPKPSPGAGSMAAGTRVRLRSEPTNLSKEQAEAMFKERKFFEVGWNSSGRFDNDWVDNGDGTLIDRATGLMWQQAGSKDSMGFSEAKAYIERVNRDGFAGYRDWRLPTLEEAASLLEPEEGEDGLYIDPRFDRTQEWIWTADTKGSGAVWDVNFVDGDAYWFDFGVYVRLCRAAGQ